MIRVLSEKYALNSLGLPECQDTGAVSIDIGRFSFLDDIGATLSVLADISYNYSVLDKDKKCDFSFVPMPDVGQRFCNDLAPFMIFDKISRTFCKPLSVKLHTHDSMKKVLCSLQMSGINLSCTCVDKEHSEVFPVPVTWYDPSSSIGDEQINESTVCISEIGRAVSEFSYQVDQFKDTYGLSDLNFNELVNLEAHLFEILGNSSHARLDGRPYGEWGFSSFVAKRDDSLVCNLCVITFGRSINESLNNVPAAVRVLSAPLDEGGEGPDVSESMAIWALMTAGLSSRRRGLKSGGLFNFFKSTQELSSALNICVMSGKGAVIRRKRRGANVKDALVPLDYDTPGTIISVRFEMEL